MQTGLTACDSLFDRFASTHCNKSRQLNRVLRHRCDVTVRTLALMHGPEMEGVEWKLRVADDIGLAQLISGTAIIIAVASCGVHCTQAARDIHKVIWTRLHPASQSRLSAHIIPVWLPSEGLCSSPSSVSCVSTYACTLHLHCRLRNLTGKVRIARSNSLNSSDGRL